MKFIDKYNAAVGAAVTLLTALFGVYWYVFAGYLLCNILDYITGWAKARKTHKESSGIGIVGIVKKVAFMIPELFIHLGQDLLGVNLSFLALLGWFTLATLLINEIRSILENLVEYGINVPDFLIKGLAITEKLISAGADTGEK